MHIQEEQCNFYGKFPEIHYLYHTVASKLRKKHPNAMRKSNDSLLNEM